MALIVRIGVWAGAGETAGEREQSAADGARCVWRGEDRRYGLAVDLETTVPGLARADAEDLVREADERCPYSNATRGNIAVEHRVRGSVA